MYICCKLKVIPWGFTSTVKTNNLQTCTNCFSSKAKSGGSHISGNVYKNSCSLSHWHKKHGNVLKSAMEIYTSWLVYISGPYPCTILWHIGRWPKIYRHIEAEVIAQLYCSSDQGRRKGFFHWGYDWAKVLIFALVQTGEVCLYGDMPSQNPVSFAIPVQSSAH